MAEVTRGRRSGGHRLARLLMTGLALFACAQPATAQTRAIDTLEFCVTESASTTSDCAWGRVTLPHRWRPDPDRPQWARYRIPVSGHGHGALGVVTSGLSPAGELRSDTQATQDSQAEARPRDLRYVPQVFAISPQAAEAPFVEIVARGHPATVNGLRALSIGPLADAMAERDRRWRTEVLWPMLVAAGTLVAGIFALLGSAGAQRLSFQLKLLGALSVLVAVRMAMNHVTEPPLALGSWMRLKLGLLLVIDVMYCLPVLAYLHPDRTERVLRIGVAGVVTAVGLAAVPDGSLLKVASVVFSALGAIGAALLVWLLARLARIPDKLGAMIAVCFAGALLAGVLDLLRHLSWISSDLVPFQRTAAPLLLVLILVLMIRETTAYRNLEIALAREAGQRGNLLRDLHDVVGSRLVALAFRAGRPGVDPVLRTGIDELLRELQMIQQVVRSAPARLDELLADIRSIYGDWSDARPRIVWAIEHSVTGVALSPEQAVATVRIVQEAIANAMRHGQPETITIRADRSQPSGTAVVRVEDDGTGAFRLGEHGGLRNMLARAQGAGLEVTFDERPGCKAVCIAYPRHALHQARSTER